MNSAEQVERWIYASYLRARPHLTETRDEQVRHPELTRSILDALGSPDASGLNAVITGSKGKGSTSVMMADILRAHGWRVGLFTSPHLLKFTERIRVDGEEIAPAPFVRLGHVVREIAMPLEGTLQTNTYIGPVGLLAAIAALYFRERRTDINIWECGRGALYDDVNQIVHRLAVLTPILTEHQRFLGPGLRDIAQHKWGVVTDDVHEVVVGRQVATVKQYIQQQLRQAGSKRCVRLGQEITVTNDAPDRQDSSFTVKTPDRVYDRLRLSLAGDFQRDNAALAIAAAEGVARRFVSTPDRDFLDPSRVRSALANVRWTGRLEWLSRDPDVLVDGTIHRQSAQHVANVLTALDKPLGILIIGIPRDKDYQGVLTELAPLARYIIWTASRRDQQIMPKDALHIAKQFCSQVQLKQTVPDAIQAGLAALHKHETLAIIGTQYLVRETLQYFNAQEIT